MNGYRFYLEYPSKTEKRKATRKNPGDHLGTAVAVILGKYHIECRDDSDGVVVSDAIGGVMAYPNSPVGSTSVSQKYLRQCKRISESMAREIHPNLFAYLDLGEDKNDN